MASPRKIAMAAGMFFFVTHVTSIAGLVLYTPILSDPGYVVGPGADTQVLVGTLLESVLAIAIVGTAVTLFPIVKRQNEGIALGYVALRTLEAAIIAVGVISLIAVVTLRQNAAGAAGQDTGALVAVGKALVAVHDWAFLLGPALVLGMSTLSLAYLMFASGLVPRFVAVLGLVGGPLVFASATATMFGVFDQVSTPAAIAAIPVFAWEISLAGWLVIKGFRPAALASHAPVPARV